MKKGLKNSYVYKEKAEGLRFSPVKAVCLMVILALLLIFFAECSQSTSQSATSTKNTEDTKEETVVITKTTITAKDVEVDTSKLLAGGTLAVSEIAKKAIEKAKVEVKIEQVEVKARTSSPVNINITMETAEKKHYTEQDVIDMAKLLTKEGGGIPSDTEQSGVPWTVLNRVESSIYPDTIHEVIVQPYQFEGWHEETVPYDRCIEIARDVLERWNREKNGEENVGRTLPKDYLFFTGDGVHNYFTKVQFGTPYVWGSELPSPYTS